MTAPGLSCSMWDLVPWPQIEPGPPALGARWLSHWTTREVPDCKVLYSMPHSKTIRLLVYLLNVLSHSVISDCLRCHGLVACQFPLSMGFSKQEYCSELPFLFPGDLPYPGIKSRSPAFQEESLLSKPLGKPYLLNISGFLLRNFIIPESFILRKTVELWNQGFFKPLSCFLDKLVSFVVFHFIKSYLFR